MASICKHCDKAIMNPEFITCSGVCGELFHSKCVGLSKATLATVANCPNMHWFCHDCNSEKISVSSSIGEMKKSIDVLASSLSNDLPQFLNGFTSLMEKFCVNIGSMNNVQNAVKVVDSPVVQAQHEKNVNLNGSNDHGRVHFDTFEPTKCVVVSNIGKGVSADFLKDFLADELSLDHSKIALSLLLPTGKTLSDLRFLQYKVTIPEDAYLSIMNPDTWPNCVRVRDFVYKNTNQNGIGVTVQNFVDKSIRIRAQG